MLTIDKELSKKIERAEARANAAFVETRAKVEPGIGACWIDVGGTYAMFDGVESPCTQSFGLGLFSDVTDASLEEIESFFTVRGAEVFHEVSPLAGPEILPILGNRGYRPIEMTSILVLELENLAEPARAIDPSITTRLIASDESDVWAEIAARGWSTEAPGLDDFMRGFGKITANCAGARPFVAESAGTPIAAGMLLIYDDVAVVAGASTTPENRNRGAQNALLAARLRFACDNGCRIAVMGALPGSQSQQNAEKNGFRIAYTRTKWQLMR